MGSISLQQQYVLQVFGVPLSNTFFTSLLVTILLVSCCFLSLYHREKNPLFTLSKSLVFEVLLLTDTITHDREVSKKVLALICTFFLFILSANSIALIPGFLGSVYVVTQKGHIPLLRSPNSDLTITLALAIFSVASAQVLSFQTLGFSGFRRRFINFQSPLSLILGFFELLSESVKIISFSFRLFGNIFAGEVLLLIIAFLVPFIIPIPFMVLEVFIGVIQAFIFSVLTLVFIQNATHGIGKEV